MYQPRSNEQKNNRLQKNMGNEMLRDKLSISISEKKTKYKNKLEDRFSSKR